MKMAESSLKRAENTVGKREIARYEQFLLFPQCFEKTCKADTEKPGFVWERVNAFAKSIDLNNIENGAKQHTINKLISERHLSASR